MFFFIAKLRALKIRRHHFLNLFDHGTLFLMKTLGASVLHSHFPPLRDEESSAQREILESPSVIISGVRT